MPAPVSPLQLKLKEIFPENFRFDYKFIVSGESDGLPKINIYDRSTGEFLIAIVFEEDEIERLTDWALSIVICKGRG